LLLAKVSVYIVELLATDYLVVFATPTSSGRPTKFVKNNVATAFFAVHLGKSCGTVTELILRWYMCLAANSFRLPEPIQPVFIVLFARGVSNMVATQCEFQR
jgi:hypothetical protein